TVSGGDELSPRLESAFHKTIKKVSGDIECLKFNTAIAAMMALMNDISEAGSVTRGELKILTILLNPFAPHITEEVWDRQKLGEGFVAQQKWPEYDESKCRDDTVEIAVQVNGKVRARLTVDAGIDQKAAVEKAEAVSKVAAEIEGKRIVKEIYVPRKLVNIVAK
ncbi:MAG TPA: leucine--tRNA ligase, partial [Ruminococcaceae bacterium]|nr:leucine--tRNA ligase [Oscillospiraceae bacterium]